ncbi:hypothetical protein BX600DRAFT_70019 [Xylariales sp. PMI_506]|nr:hypothetical protein BX600DRAFT_70019 [Xylariales sp. PMI_506]
MVHRLTVRNLSEISKKYEAATDVIFDYIAGCMQEVVSNTLIFYQPPNKSNEDTTARRQDALSSRPPRKRKNGPTTSEPPSRRQQKHRRGGQNVDTILETPQSQIETHGRSEAHAAADLGPGRCIATNPNCENSRIHTVRNSSITRLENNMPITDNTVTPDDAQDRNQVAEISSDPLSETSSQHTSSGREDEHASVPPGPPHQESFHYNQDAHERMGERNRSQYDEGLHQGSPNRDCETTPMAPDSGRQSNRTCPVEAEKSVPNQEGPPDFTVELSGNMAQPANNYHGYAGSELLVDTEITDGWWDWALASEEFIPANFNCAGSGGSILGPDGGDFPLPEDNGDLASSANM